jgi:hypothetical protein
MVVIATPAAQPVIPTTAPLTTTGALFPVSCAGQNVISAPVSAVNGAPVLSRMRAVAVNQGQCATVAWQLHDKDGHPVSLQACGFPDDLESSSALIDYRVVLRLKEQLSWGNAKVPFEVEATVVNAAEGRVQAELTAAMTQLPGIYYAEMALVSTVAESQDLPCVVFSNTFSMVVTRSLFGSEGESGGPPSIAEIRLHLRDSSPAESYLLDNIMFDDAEIALAITRPVMYWNEIPPPLDDVFNTQNFPFRYHWLEGIAANLFFMVAEQYRRNDFQYNAAGMQINDQNKAPMYEQAAQTRWQGYKDWVRATKASINLEGCYGEVTSNYKYSAYASGLRLRY